MQLLVVWLNMNLPTQSTSKGLFFSKLRLMLLAVISHPDSLIKMGVHLKYFFIALAESVDAAIIKEAFCAALCTLVANVIDFYLLDFLFL